MTRKGNIKRGVGRVLLHAVLIFGSFVFSIPFIWLASTSAKVPDEIYPPEWLPEIPPGVTESPYIALRDKERPARPAGVADSDWERLRIPIVESIQSVVREKSEAVPAFYRPYLDETALAEKIFARLLRRTPDEVFEKTEAVAQSYFAQETSLAIVQEEFDAVYRRLALADVVFHQYDATAEYPTADKTYPWKVVSGDARLVYRDSGLRRIAQEVHYGFSSEKEFSVSIQLPLGMAPEELRKIVVSNHADRSWHEVWAAVDVGGTRYEAVEPAYLGSDKWQETTWQFASEGDETLLVRTWVPLIAKGASGFNVPGETLLTLRFVYNSRPAATYDKYANNYREVLRRVPMLSYLKNSFLLVGLNILGQILGSSLVAFAFARLKWPGREFYFVLVLATLMIPPQVTMIPLFLIFRELGWYNTLRPLWVPAFFGSAFYIFLLRQFMRGIPKELEDSAKIDGCGYFGIYWRVILPLVKPALATIGIFTFMTVWNDFMGPLIYLSDQRLYPLSLGLFALQVVQGPNINYGVMMAASVIMTIPVIALFFAAQRQFIQGITLTGLKG